MTNIIQNVSITKHINPSKQISDEYSLMITYHDVVYITKIKEEDFNSVLFEFDMLENLIYNCNHKQKVGDICCDMTITESESFGKILDITLLFERDVKPMKKINEKHGFQLQEKKLDYDDKIGLAMTNLRNEINFVEIKPTTNINIIDLIYPATGSDLMFGHQVLVTNSRYYVNKSLPIISESNKQHIFNQLLHQFNNMDKTQLMNSIKFINKFRKYCKLDKIYEDDKVNLDISTYINFLTEFINTYYHIKNNEIYLHHDNLNKLIKFICNFSFVDMIKIISNKIYVFTDKTKKSNNRKIKFYENIEEFIKNREQFKTYHILDMTSYGILIEEID